VSGSEFERELGLLDATSIGLGTMIGGGIFILPSIAAAQAGPASAISFAVAGVVSLLSALSHSEIATDMQDTDGGSYEYVHRALGPVFGSVVGWGMWIGLIFATAFYAVGFAQYLTFLFGGLPVAPVAAALALALVGLNYYGAAEASEIEDAIVLLLLLLIVVFVAGGVPAIESDQLRPFNPNGWAAVLATTGTIYVSFIGFAVIATATAEIENPDRNLPLSMVAAVVIPTVLYVSVMIVSTGVLPAETLQGSRVPVAEVAAQYAGDLGALAMVIGAALATISSANASILAAGRVGYAMGTDRLLTDRLARISDRFGTPARTIIATGAGIVVLVVLPVGIDILAEVASFMYLLTYGLVHVAVVRLRRSDGAYDPTFRIPSALYPAAPVLGVLATLAIMTQMDVRVIAGGVALVAAGVAWYLLYVRYWTE
jgi:amino acid transporter